MNQPVATFFTFSRKFDSYKLLSVMFPMNESFEIGGNEDKGELVGYG